MHQYNPPLDRNNLRKEIKLNEEYSKEKLLRSWFIKNEDVKIAKLIWNYFEAVVRNGQQLGEPKIYFNKINRNYCLNEISKRFGRDIRIG